VTGKAGVGLGVGVSVSVGGTGVKVAVGLGVRVGVGVGMGVPGAQPAVSQSNVKVNTITKAVPIRFRDMLYCAKRFISIYKV
jgi:hypothetical protein